jgi:FAD/FMN-containing dehydrogenase
MIDLVPELKRLVGDAFVTDSAEAVKSGLGGRGRLGVPVAVVKPASTAEVAAVLRLVMAPANRSCLGAG